MNNAQFHGCPLEGWVCFHCGELFTTVGGAADHFGTSPDREAACQIKLGDERGLVMALRQAEDRRDVLAGTIQRLRAVFNNPPPMSQPMTVIKRILDEADTTGLTQRDSQLQIDALQLASTLYSTMDRHSARHEITRRITRLREGR